MSNHQDLETGMEFGIAEYSGQSQHSSPVCLFNKKATHFVKVAERRKEPAAVRLDQPWAACLLDHCVPVISHMDVNSGDKRGVIRN
jgi:hypothetical protein